MAIMELSSLLEQMKQIEAQEASLLSVASDRQAQVRLRWLTRAAMQQLNEMSPHIMLPVKPRMLCHIPEKRSM